MKPAFKALRTRLVHKAMKEVAKKRRCPKCKKTRDVKKFFGFRTRHDAKGKPKRALVQSYCTDCRS